MTTLQRLGQHAVLQGQQRISTVDPEVPGYLDVVRSIPNLLAYWRFSSLTGIDDIQPGNRDGTFDSAVTLVGGLPQGSDQAVRLGGAARGTVPTDAGLDLGAFTLSLWVNIHETPDDTRALLAREQSGLFLGDFAIYLQDDELRCQFQDGSTQHVIIRVASLGAPTHLLVTADGSGFAFWVDGQHIGTNTAFTNAWASNGNDLIFGSAQQLTTELDMTIDEVAIYSRVLNQSEILELAQRTNRPVAANISGLTVTENGGTVTIDVAANSTYVGTKDDLIITLGDEEDFGNASVDGNNDIVFTAGAVSANQADSFTYTITDANGESAAATISLTVQNNAVVSGDGLGGTLVYEWVPTLAMATGAINTRNEAVLQTTAPWINGATVGGSLVKAVIGGGLNCGFNRAPDGDPALEIYTHAGSGGGSSMINLGVQLWNELDDASAPRQIRVVMEVKTCKPSDPTTYKSAGFGTPLTGSYPNWTGTYRNVNGTTNTTMKYFVGAGAGVGLGGGGRLNWWNAYQPITADYTASEQSGNANVRCATARMTTGSTGEFRPYAYAYSRPGQFGTTIVDTMPEARQTGYVGVWHTIEIEFKLTTPSTIASNTTLKLTNPPTSPTQTGNGFQRNFVRRDIDNEVGLSGVRTECNSLFNLTWCCKQDLVNGHNNMHTRANIAHFWINLIYGGGIGSQGAGWAWIRKIQVYRYD